MIERWFVRLGHFLQSVWNVFERADLVLIGLLLAVALVSSLLGPTVVP